MSLQNFIPELWAASLLHNLHIAHVFANPLVVNRDYEGEIRDFGDTVRINAIGPITVSDYTRNTDIASPETVQAAQTILSISQAKYFNFAVDDVDKAQIKPQVMGEAMYEAGYAIAQTSDTYLASIIDTGVSSTNTIGSSGSPKTDLATDKIPYGYLVQAAQKLDEANVPRNGRWAIVPPWFYAYILKDSNFLHSTDLADILLRQGLVQPGQVGDMNGGPDGQVTPDATSNTLVGMIAGFNVFMSNNVVVATGTGVNAVYEIVFGHRSAWTYAEQIVKVEAYRPPYRFSDAVKGLHVYGAKVTRPQALGILYAKSV